MQNSPPPGGTEFDRLLGATPAIADAVKQFDDPEIRRAMFDNLVSALGVQSLTQPTAPADLRVVQTPAAGPASASGAPQRAETPSGQQNGSDFFARMAHESGVSETDLRDVLSVAADGKVSVTPATRKLGTTIAEQARTVIALVASARGVGLEEDPVSAEQVRAEVKRKGCYDSRNFHNHLGALNGFNSGSSRNQIVLTSKWIDEFKAAVAKAHGRASATSSSSTRS